MLHNRKINSQIIGRDILAEYMIILIIQFLPLYQAVSCSTALVPLPPAVLSMIILAAGCWARRTRLKGSRGSYDDAANRGRTPDAAHPFALLLLLLFCTGLRRRSPPERGSALACTHHHQAALLLLLLAASARPGCFAHDKVCWRHYTYYSLPALEGKHSSKCGSATTTGY
jgi:hypothetical protein